MLSRRLKKLTYPLRFRNLNSPCVRISTHIDVYEPSEDDYWLFIAKLDDICFCQLPAAIFVPLRGTQTWRLYTKPYKFGKTFLRISPARNIAQT